MFSIEVHQQVSSRVILEIKERIIQTHEFEYDLQITSTDIELLISQTAVRIDLEITQEVRSPQNGKKYILNLKVADAAINISTFLVQERKEEDYRDVGFP